jgi:hypothetical protein
MRQSPVIRQGLERAGFTGGWLERKGQEELERKIG